MRLLILFLLCILVPLLPGTSGTECIILDIRDASKIDMNASSLVPGVSVTQLEKVEVNATDPQTFGDNCAKECCKSRKYTVLKQTG